MDHMLIKPLRRALALILFLIPGVVLPGGGWAQDQPVAATNSQDERVNINCDTSSKTDQLTIFRTGDKSQMNHYISRVVEMKNAPSYEMLTFALQAAALEKGTARALKYTDPQTGANRNFMQIITTAEQMPSIVESIHALDMPGMTNSSGSDKINYRLRFRKASEIAPILAATTLSPDGKVNADDVTNTIYVLDSPSQAARVLLNAQYYDVPPLQVEFEITMFEVDEDGESNLGLDWEAWKNSLGGQLEWTGNWFEGAGRTFSRGDGLLTLDAKVLADFLNFIAQKGDAKVINRTKIVATNNKPGTVTATKRVPFRAYTTTFQDAKELTEKTPGVTAAGETPGSTTVGDRPVVIQPPSRSVLADVVGPADGLEVTVSPTIGTEMVTADFSVHVFSLTGYTSLGTPIISDRTVKTTATLKDGDPLSLGGFDKTTTGKVRKGIPGLKDIPVIQYAFSVERDADRHSKVFVLATPKFRNQIMYQPGQIKMPQLAPGSKDFDTKRVVPDNPSSPITLQINPAAKADGDPFEKEGMER